MVVKLGELEFDPIEPQDFRLNIEGASKTGKSNTLAVILEDLIGVNIPTLIIERLNMLSSVRQLDDHMIVVGGEDSKGVDLVIPIENLSIVIDLMFDKNLKVILDISTYQDIEEDYHTEHKAVARVLQELDKRAQENLRTGNRKKSLVICDEVHYLAPESNVRFIDTSDKYVKRSLSYLIRLYTEGGNKGINMITAYQRRAYTTKGIVSQADNYITHRLHITDRGDVAKEIGVDEEEVGNLEQGEVIIYGDITKQRVVGATKVRKRNSPDPREQEFELPERTGDVGKAIQEIQEKIDIEHKEKQKELNRIEELENRLEKKEKELERLREDREIQQKIARALSGIESEDITPEVKEELEELERIREEKEQLDDKISELNNRIEEYEGLLAEKDEKIEDLKAEKSELKQLDMVKEDIISDARSILRKLGAESPDEAEAREKIEELREEIEDKDSLLEQRERRLKELKEKKGGITLDEDFKDAMDFLEHDRVQEEVEKVMDNNRHKPEHAWDILLVLAKKGACQIDDIVPLTDISKTSVNRIIPDLNRHKIIQKERRGKKTYYSVNTENLRDIIKKQKEREELNDLRQKVRGDNYG